MGLFDVFKKKQEKKIYSPKEIVELARTHKPDSIYEDGHLIPEVEAAVNQIMHYDGISNISTMLMLNNPADMQNKMKEADVDTLLIFFKFLAIKASETNNNQSIGVVQQYLISVLQQKLQ